MKNILLKLPFALVLTLCLACGNKTETNPQESAPVADAEVTEAQFKNASMQLAGPTEAVFPDWVEASGMIDVPPENRAVITPYLGGYVRDNPLLIGDAVKKGQPLITLENPEFVSLQQQFQELGEQLEYLKSEYERQQTLAAENITSKKNFLKAESEYKRSLATYNGLQKQLQLLNISTTQAMQGNYSSLARIYAPINGTIARTFVSKGSYVSPADPLMEIVDIDHIHLELKVFEKDMLKVKKDQAIAFKIPESSPEYYDGTVHLIGNSLDMEGRTVTVHGHIDNERGTPHFAVGMFIEARINTGETEALALPETAVVNLGESFYALQLQEQKEGSYRFDRVEIKPGKTQNGMTEILNSAELTKDAQYLTKGAFELIQE
ncbi:MAG: efflux transporter periplasmic adaptor subunit [Leeuwenhoekiella sp.]|nr:MAG: efflux transporter periplasmic adaptor subunit [Leeuwenhoekiella sp.]